MATAVATSLPEVALAAGTTITVSLDVAGAKVTKLNVYGPSGVLVIEPDPVPVPPLFAYAQDAV